MSAITHTRKKIDALIRSLKDDGCPTRKINQALKGDVEDGSDYAFDLGKLSDAWLELGSLEQEAYKKTVGK